MPGSLFSRVRLDRIFRPRYNFGSSIFTNEEFCAMYIADLHIHSRYSRATSKDCTPEHLDLWARRKGIHLVGSGDFTHPAWREELKEKLRQDENGLYVLKEEYRLHEDSVPDDRIPRFVITGEISSIYKQGGKVRKVHSLILLPDLQKAEIISRKLEEIGNIHSDGRPILGISCHDLLEIILELCPEAVYVPAHIWTPHFSMFGAFSGFDSVEECFGDLSGYVHAVETGLSSDPPMNWRVSALDRFQLISNSDAHSPAKLGREANLLDTEISYQGLKTAVETGAGLLGTIEFFPEEGKYHMDGHRKCGLCLSPKETEKYGGICPVCGRKITIGVSHRIEQMADRPEQYQRPGAKRFESLIPLPEIIGAALGHSSASKGVQREYQKLTARLGAEFEILRNIPVEEIRHVSGRLIAEGIERLRAGKVTWSPGFDGEYGKVRIFDEEERNETDGQMDFFSMLGMKEEVGKQVKSGKAQEKKVKASEAVTTERKEADKKQTEDREVAEKRKAEAAGKNPDGLNEKQRKAVHSPDRRTAVIAGPGTGKTKTLIARLLYLVNDQKINPDRITAVTFTNQAAGEIRDRLQKAGEQGSSFAGLQTGTFHAICLRFLKERGVRVLLADESRCIRLAEEILARFGIDEEPKEFLEQAAKWKEMQIMHPEETGEKGQKESGRTAAYEAYGEEMEGRGLFSFEDLLLETVRLLKEYPEEKGWRKPFGHLLIDEFQDISPVQYELMKEWNRGGESLFVIGDPDQAIYGFRGSDARCFERLHREFPDLSMVRLEENYRSTPQILNSSLAVISENPGGERILHPNQKDVGPVRMLKTGGEMAEAIAVAKEIGRMAGGIGMLEAQRTSEEKERKIRSFHEIAVLYRTHRQGELLETCLRKEGIPYVVSGRESFLKDETVRRSAAFFRYLLDPEQTAAKEEGSLLFTDGEGNPLGSLLFEETAQVWKKKIQEQSPAELLKEWIREMGMETNKAMEKLSRMAICYETIEELLTMLELGVESDLKRCGEKQYTAEAVRLMTLHGSKGLEFPAVILYGAEQGKIPLENEYYETDFEEERRLLYVGMTRAKEELILTSAGEESPFLKSLSGDLLQRETAGRKKQQELWHQMSLFE